MIQRSRFDRGLNRRLLGVTDREGQVHLLEISGDELWDAMKHAVIKTLQKKRKWSKIEEFSFCE